MRSPHHKVKGRPCVHTDEYRQSLWDMRKKNMTWVEIGLIVGCNARNVEKQAKKLYGDEDSKWYRPRIIRETSKWSFHGQDVVSIY